MALVHAHLGRYEGTTTRELSFAKVLSAPVSASSLPLQGRAAVALCPSSEAMKIQNETQMEEKLIGKEAHPTAHAAAARGSPQLCPMRRPVQSGALPVTEVTPWHWRLQVLFTILETLNDVFCNLKTPRAPLLLGRPSANSIFLLCFPSSCGTHRRWQPATVENLLRIKATPSFFFFARFTELFIPTPHAPNATSVYIFVQPTRLFLLKNHMPYLFRHVANTPCSLPLPLALPASGSVTPILAGAAGENLRNVSVLASAL